MGTWTSRRGAVVLRLVVGVSVAGGVLTSSESVLAQSAADKATARKLAVEGIKLYEAGKHAEALDKLQRAQALYDAPVHLIYIARAQVKLGQLVDGAESYRKLIRYKLEPGAPKVFRDAVADAKQELPEVEPRIPSLRIDVKPTDVAELTMTIDGQNVSSAVLGVERPINPGEHTVRIEAPGYSPVEQSVTVAEREKKVLPIELERDESQPLAGGAAAGGTGQGEGGGKGPEKAPGKGEPTKKKDEGFWDNVGFLIGLRLSGALPGGKLGGDEAIGTIVGPTGVMVTQGSNPADFDADVSEYFGPGGGGELRGGIRIAKHFTPMVFFEQHQLQPQDGFDQVTLPPSAEQTNVVVHRAVGIGVMLGTPAGQVGGYGEIGLVLADQYVAQTEVIGGAQGDCDYTTTFTGGAFRVGGGANFPVASFLHLTPFAAVSIGSFSEVTQEVTDGACTLGNGSKTQTTTIPEDRTEAHTTIVLGLGGDFVFGADLP